MVTDTKNYFTRNFSFLTHLFWGGGILFKRTFCPYVNEIRKRTLKSTSYLEEMLTGPLSQQSKTSELASSAISSLLVFIRLISRDEISNQERKAWVTNKTKYLQDMWTKCELPWKCGLTDRTQSTGKILTLIPYCYLSLCLQVCDIMMWSVVFGGKHFDCQSREYIILIQSNIFLLSAFQLP